MLSSTFREEVTLITALRRDVCQLGILRSEINSLQKEHVSCFAIFFFWTRPAPSNLLNFHRWKGANL